MRPTLLCLFVLLPLVAFGDGKVFAPVAVRDAVTIPGQRALIHWSGGTERLVIETRFTGAGSNFAWVVPLPAKPVIEKAPSGLFPTLEYLFQPELVHTVPRWYLAVFALLGLAYLLYAIKPGREPGWKSVLAFLIVCVSCFAANSVVGFLVFFLLGIGLLIIRAGRGSLFTILLLLLLGLILTGLLLPAGKPRGMAYGFSRNFESVELLEHNRVGAYETVTIASKDPLALGLWLRENGFAVSSNATPVITDYVQRGWVFVAARLSRDQADQQTSTIHPLSFTFPVAEAVYPMRLTGVDSEPLSVDLYVFGSARAAATNFAVRCCTRPAFPRAPSEWIRSKSEELDIYTPPLTEWVRGATVATKLSAKLAAQQLGQDIVITWEPFWETRIREFSYPAARHYATNWASLVLVILLLVSCLGLLSSRVSWLWRARWLSLAVVVLVGAILYSSLEKVPVSFYQRGYLASQSPLRRVVGSNLESAPTIQEFRDEMASMINENPRLFENRFLGGVMHEEDSPGNYMIHETENAIELIGYDAAGAPHVIGSKSKTPGNQ